MKKWWRRKRALHHPWFFLYAKFIRDIERNPGGSVAAIGAFHGLSPILAEKIALRYELYLRTGKIIKDSAS